MASAPAEVPAATIAPAETVISYTEPKGGAMATQALVSDIKPVETVTETSTTTNNYQEAAAKAAESGEATKSGVVARTSASTVTDAVPRTHITYAELKADLKARAHEKIERWHNKKHREEAGHGYKSTGKN